MDNAVLADWKETKTPNMSSQISERVGGSLVGGDVELGELGDADLLQIRRPSGLLEGGEVWIR